MKIKFLKKLLPSLSSILYPLSSKKKGQATTEIVLLLPLFMIILFFIVKIFALLVLIQKMEIASYYAARRWQLQSHLNVDEKGHDEKLLKGDKYSILEIVRDYIGFYNKTTKGLLNLKNVDIEVNRTMVWSVVTLKVDTDPLPQKLHAIFCRYPEGVVCSPYGQKCIDGYKYLCSGNKTLQVIKYVPNRDRPLKFSLPGLK